MTLWVVVDSGIFLKTVLPEDYSDEADKLFKHWQQQGVNLAAPSLFQYEVISVLRKSVVRKVITEAQAQQALLIFSNLTIAYSLEYHLLSRAYELATQLNRPTAYDAQYLALAEHLQCEFWTQDERLYNAVRSQLKWVKWLGTAAP